MNEVTTTTTEPVPDYHVVETAAGSVFYENGYVGVPTHAFTIPDQGLSPITQNVIWNAFKQGKVQGYNNGRKAMQDEFKRNLGLI